MSFIERDVHFSKIRQSNPNLKDTETANEADEIIILDIEPDVSTIQNINTNTDDKDNNHCGPHNKDHDESNKSETIELQKQGDNCDFSNHFMDTVEAYSVLKSEKPALLKIPPGKKENQYFVVQNRRNIEKRLKGKQSHFVDDCGVWDTGKGSTKKVELS